MFSLKRFTISRELTGLLAAKRTARLAARLIFCKIGRLLIDEPDSILRILLLALRDEISSNFDAE